MMPIHKTGQGRRIHCALVWIVSAVFIAGLSACGDAGRELHTGDAPADGRFKVGSFAGPIGDAGIYGHPLWDSPYDLSEIAYVEEEYFVSGVASSHTGAEDAPYTTRVIVRRPSSQLQFNGTVILDWVNVTAQFENAVDTLQAHQLFHRDGYAYVHMSAQAAGLCCAPELTPQMWDPVRYAELSHPGDDYAFDIVTQIAAGFKYPDAVDPMSGLNVEKIIAVGQSQSASRLYTYVNEVQARAGVIDGFLIHAGGAKDFGARSPAPVIQLLGDREATPEEPTTSENYRLWEVAGAAHQDLWVGEHQEIGQVQRAVLHLPKQPMSADEDMHQITANYGEQVDPASQVCIAAGSQFPTRYAVMAAIDHLDRWIRDGVPPPQPPRYEFDASGALATDDLGNALGGMRYPPIDVPVARYLSAACNLGGTTIPLTEVELLQRYPTFENYQCKMLIATERSLAQGILLQSEADELLGRVENAQNRWLAAGVSGGGQVQVCVTL